MFQPVAFLALISALFYCAAMVAMKSMAQSPSAGLALIVAAALIGAGVFEVLALRQERLGMIYMGILGAEVVILGSLSLVHFDEGYSIRELIGMGIVLMGTAIAWT